MAAPDATPSLSVDEVERLPALGGAQFVRARGRGERSPALSVGERRLEPLAEGPLGREPGTWSASFVLPADAVGEPAWLEWPGGPRLELPPVPEPAGAEVIAHAVLDERRARRASPVPAPAPAEPPPAWEAHRCALEREVARAAEVAAAARDETAARVAAHAAELRAARSEAAARVFRAEEVATAAGVRLRGAVAAAAATEARLQSEAIARGALEAELARLRAEVAELVEALAAERVTREAAGRALAAATADALAARRVRAAEAAAGAALAAELEAERAAHAVTRGSVARLREELIAAARPPAVGEPAVATGAHAVIGEPATAAGAPAAVGEPAVAAGAPSLPSPVDLRRLAAAQAAAAAARPPTADAGRLVADLDAAAAALRHRDLGPPRRLRDALVALAHEDPQAAGALLVQMLPALGAVVAERLSYDLAITGVGIYAVTIADGGARVVRLRRPRPRGQADLALIADPLALAEWLAGGEVRIGRFRGRIRRRGSRSALAPLRAVPATPLSFTAAARAGARPDPGLALRALAHAIDPEWTRGHAFTVAQTIDDETWHVTARDGDGLEIGAAAAEPPDATVTLTGAAFDRLLRDEPPERGDLPAIRGDRAAIATLRDWIDRVLGGGSPHNPDQSA